MPKTILTLLVPVVALFLLGSPRQLLAESPPCPQEKALLSANEPIYVDATQLAQDLASHGFVVKCIFPTNLGSIFMVEENGIVHSTIEGEACLRTNYGDIDVVFVPKPQTFTDFKITEHREGGGYLYTFAGTPRVWSVNRFGSAVRSYFLKYQNRLLLVSDDQLRARLEDALQLKP